jgi:diaminohydroxyphosphoribosylaminopyrimidine deaminase / 5-amino-6-(5-phosphoribosylamino)uracil reductase
MNKEYFINRCIELARQGQYLTRPNPMVGAVIAIGDSILAEGYHQIHGGEHAERIAFNKLPSATDLENATLYVNLEPCCHHGKTPPCTSLIIEKGIKNVVIGCTDTSDKVAGRGLQALQKAGVNVKTNILQEQCRSLNRRFFTFHEKKRPYIILKWAQTSDGFIAKKNGASKWISNEESRSLTHRWRAQEASILVGTNTALIDNPNLTARNLTLEKNSYRQPIRLVIDKQIKIPSSYNIYNNESKTILFTETTKHISDHTETIQLDFNSNIPLQILKYLHSIAITSVLIEGGTQVLNSFIASNLWDEARVFTSDQSFNEGIAAPTLNDKVIFENTLSNDILRIYTNHNFEVLNDWL